MKKYKKTGIEQNNNVEMFMLLVSFICPIIGLFLCLDNPKQGMKFGAAALLNCIFMLLIFI